MDDAVLYMLHQTLSFLDGPGWYVKLVFFDFSSTFNTTQPLILRGKLEQMEVDPILISWIHNYLTERPQYVRLGDCVSRTLVSNTGDPQGTVLSPFIFTLCTAEFACKSASCHIQKYSDDTAVTCVKGKNEGEYRRLITTFTDWSNRNGLILNTSKTGEMIVDFGRKKLPRLAVTIDGEIIEVVQSYRYLGIHLDSKLDSSVHSSVLYKKGQNRFF